MPRDREDVDLEIPVYDPTPHISPGRYEARSVGCSVRWGFRRRTLVVEFDVFAGPATDGEIIGRIPGYFRLPEPRNRRDRLAASSKLYRWYVLLGVPLRQGRLSPRALMNKLWLVEIGDVTQSAETGPDREQRRLHPRQVYSVVRAVLERLA